MTTDTATRIGIYARISGDKSGQQTATARQTQDARAVAERRGWEVVDTFEAYPLVAVAGRSARAPRVRHPGTWPDIFTPEESLRLRSTRVQRNRRGAP